MSRWVIAGVSETEVNTAASEGLALLASGQSPKQQTAKSAQRSEPPAKERSPEAAATVAAG